MIESRCGIVCSECEYKKQKNCNSCINIIKPFWGYSCPIKECAENKNIENCGKCNDFPCDLLKKFSFDKK